MCLHNRILQSGETPLWLACCHGHQENVELLIEAGADVDYIISVSLNDNLFSRCLLIDWICLHVQ